jgi:hypothetical protein
MIWFFSITWNSFEKCFKAQHLMCACVCVQACVFAQLFSFQNCRLFVDMSRDVQAEAPSVWHSFCKNKYSQITNMTQAIAYVISFIRPALSSTTLPWMSLQCTQIRFWHPFKFIWIAKLCSFNILYRVAVDPLCETDPLEPDAGPTLPLRCMYDNHSRCWVAKLFGLAK